MCERLKLKWLPFLTLSALLFCGPAGAQAPIRIMEFHQPVELLPLGASAWVAPQTNQTLHPSDRLRTGRAGSLALLWSDRSVLRFGALTEIEILPPDAPGADHGLHLIRGLLSFFHRDQPGRIRIITSGALAGIEGTELVMAVAATNGLEQTTLSVLDGKVRFGNAAGALVLTNGEQAVAGPGLPPRRSPGFIANNLLQWCFYYPGVLVLDDLPLTGAEKASLADSLAAYRDGDLPAALSKFSPPDNGSPATRLYQAALLLSAGDVAAAEVGLAALSEPPERIQRLAAALRHLIAAVKRQDPAMTAPPQLATEWLATSYFEQSRAVRETSLQQALVDARQAVTLAPQSGFAWERVAELEFSFGRTGLSLTALEQALRLSPRNAQALALKGFLLAAQNRTRDAIGQFDRALAVDSALPNAWLGRGLCRIRRGEAPSGREDLLMAAALEPQRSELRSYLGKAYGFAGDRSHAVRELALAKQLDPRDPTAWLYSALLNQRNNEINDAIRDLEKSQALNDNRSVYRSQLLLDEDTAVRSVNLAGIYRDAGMTEVSLREAGRAVNSDYANYSAHLFLAQSYAQMVAPNEINQRFELPSQREFLLANLLAPASAGLLSPTISQGDDTRLFERNRFGVASDTEYLRRKVGEAWTQSGAQYGTFDDFSYAAEAYYHSDPGQDLNSDIYQRQLSLTLKQQLTPQDSVFFSALQYEGNIGSTYLNYNNNKNVFDLSQSAYHYKENQDPTLTLGYHREWGPGVHTLFLASRLDDSIAMDNQNQLGYLVDMPDNNIGVPTLATVGALQSQVHTRQNQEIYSGELQQIWEAPSHTTILGSRLQYGYFDTTVDQSHRHFGRLLAQRRWPSAADAGFFFAFQTHQRLRLSPVADLRAAAADRRVDIRSSYLSGKCLNGPDFQSGTDR